MITITDIPKIAHFVWLGKAPMPGTAEENIDRFFELHPGWRIEIWDDARIQAVVDKNDMIAAAWDRHRDSIQMRVMITKMAALWLEGGVAPDTDIYMMRCIESITARKKDNFFATQRKGEVSSCFFGSVKGHYLLQIAFGIATAAEAMTPNQLLFAVRDTWPRPRFNVVPEHYFCPIKVRSEALEFLRKFPKDQIVDLEKRRKRYADEEMPFGVHLMGSDYQAQPMFAFDYPNEPTAYPEGDYEVTDLTLEEERMVSEQGIGVIKDNGKRAGFFRKLVNVTTAAGRVVKAVAKKEPLAVDPEVIKRRLEICKTSGEGGKPCHYMSGITCTKCGCVLAFKQRLATESCPIGRWIIIGSLLLSNCIELGFC